jgi:hypothetical protein
MPSIAGQKLGLMIMLLFLFLFRIVEDRRARVENAMVSWATH